MPLYRAGRPVPGPLAAGQYFFPCSEGAAATSGALGTGTLRLIPWLVESAMRIDRLGAEVSTIGDVGSKFRIGLYQDTGACYPGALLVDAGQIAGDSATGQDLTITTLALPAALYWIGGVVQTVTTTQPTIRTVSNWTPPVSIGAGTSLPSAGATLLGYSQSGVTGALPSNFTSTVSAIGVASRPLVRAA